MTGIPERSNPRQAVFRDPVQFLAFGFGTGLAPRAPGTFGTLPGLLLGWLCASLELEWRLAIGAFLIIAGVWICGEAARRIGVHDHPGIVWDEIAGMYMTVQMLPAEIGPYAMAFIAFRVFDIWKPWPIRDLDHRLAGGTGIMLDDLVAALYAVAFLSAWGWVTG